MEKEKIIGFSILVVIYIFLSWSLGRFINKYHKKIETTEFQNVLSGAWILGIIIVFFIIYGYFG